MCNHIKDMESCQLNLVCWASHPDWSWLQNAHQLGPCWWQISSISSHNIVYIHLHWTWFTQTTVMGVKPGSEYFLPACHVATRSPYACCNARIEKFYLCDVMCCNMHLNHFICTSSHNATQAKILWTMLYCIDLTSLTELIQTAKSLTQLRNHGEKLYIILHVNTCNYYIQRNLANLDLHV